MVIDSLRNPLLSKCVVLWLSFVLLAAPAAADVVQAGHPPLPAQTAEREPLQKQSVQRIAEPLLAQAAQPVDAQPVGPEGGRGEQQAQAAGQQQPIQAARLQRPLPGEQPLESPRLDDQSLLDDLSARTFRFFW